MNWIKVHADYLTRIGAAVCDRPICSPWLLDLAATIWCRDHANEGTISIVEIGRCAPWKSDGPSPDSIANQLVKAGVWSRDGDAFPLNDFDRQSVPRELRESRSAAGTRGAETRWNGMAKHGKNGKRCQKWRGEEKRREEKRSSPSTEKNPSPLSPSPREGEINDSPDRPETPKETLDRWEREYHERGSIQPKDVIWQHYFRRYYDSTGQAPLDDARHFAAIARLLKRCSVEDIKARIGVYFSPFDAPFPCREGAKDFARFVKYFDQLAPRCERSHIPDAPPPIPQHAPPPPEELDRMIRDAGLGSLR